MPVLEVAVEAGLVERGDRAEAHRHRRELPEVGHQAGVRVRREAATVASDLPAEVVEVVFGEPALEECPGVDARCRVALVVHVVAGAAVVFAAEEVVEADLVQRRGTGERREVAADAVGDLVRPHDHHRGVPANEGPDPTLDVLVAGEPRLLLARDRVDVRRRHRGGERHLAGGRSLHEPGEQVAGTRLAVGVDDGVEAVQPLLGLGRIDVGQLVHVAVEDHGRQSRSVTERYAPAWPANRPPEPEMCADLTAGDRPPHIFRLEGAPVGGAGSEGMSRLRPWPDSRSTPTEHAAGIPARGAGRGRSPREGEPSGAGGEAHTTNQRMEIHAVLDALRTHADRADEHGAPLPIEIVSDSTYVVNCFRDKWWVKWQRNGWTNSQKKPVANVDLWQPLIELVQAGDVSFRWVKGPQRRPHERPRRPAGRRGGPDRTLSGTTGTNRQQPARTGKNRSRSGNFVSRNHSWRPLDLSAQRYSSVTCVEL